MQVLTPNHKILETKNSIFLAGTTPKKRKNDWRKKVIKMLEESGFDGVVYNPDYTDLKIKPNYKEQIVWEFNAMASSGVVAFWVNRDMPRRPGLTTNVEFGYHLPRSNVVYGRSDKSEKCFYLDYIYLLEQNKQPVNTLEDLVKEIMVKVK